MTAKPNFGGNVRKVLERIKGAEIKNRIFSDPRKGYQRVKVWGFNATDMAQIEDEMIAQFGDRFISVHNQAGRSKWTYKVSLVVKIAK